MSRESQSNNMIVENIKNIRKINNINLLRKIDDDTGDQKFNIHEKAKKLKSGVELGENFILFRKRANKTKQIEDNNQLEKPNKRTLSCVGVQKIKNEHPNAAVVKSRLKDSHRASLTPTNLRSLSICSKDDILKDNRFRLKRRCESTMNRSNILKNLRINKASPIRQKHSILMPDSSNIKHEHASHKMTHEREDALKVVERRIIQKYSNSPVENFHNIRRFKQLQEYMNMYNREVIINHNLRNEEHRIVKGELPLGTDTQIKHEVRENFPKIKDIKNRLKNCLSIKCDFDEVIKYAKQYYDSKGDLGGSQKNKLLTLNQSNSIKKQEFEQQEIQEIKKESKEKKREDKKKDDKKETIELKEIKEAKEIQKGKEDKNEEIDCDLDMSISFTKKKWNNIDELIEVLKEELEENKK